MTPHTVSVGIIANPASGSDIRRLVALGSVHGTQEKINIIQRALVGLAATEIDQIYIMPDVYCIGESALERLSHNQTVYNPEVVILDMQPENCGQDSTNAARQMHAAGVGCIIVLGGDGTSRVVAKGCSDTPILPISTGTNNVIPYAVEGTVAGLAAGFVARHPDKKSDFTYRSKWLNICIQDVESDMALVDIAVVDGQAVGSRAVWEPEGLRQAILTRAEPKTTGISSLGGFVQPVSPLDPWGLHILFGKPVDHKMTAPLAPGLMVNFGVERLNKLSFGDTVTIQGYRCILALDGEREILLRQDQSAQITLRQDGPWIVDVFKTLQIAAEEKMLAS